MPTITLDEEDFRRLLDRFADLERIVDDHLREHESLDRLEAEVQRRLQELGASPTPARVTGEQLRRDPVAILDQILAGASRINQSREVLVSKEAPKKKRLPKAKRPVEPSTRFERIRKA